MFPEENISLILIKIIQILEKWLKGIMKTYDRYPMIDFQWKQIAKINSFGLNRMIRVKAGNQNWVVKSCRHSAWMI